MPKRVIVVGAGIIGSSIAYHLAKAGADVLVLDDQSHPGGLATSNSWAWLNASWGNDRQYVALRMESMQLWRELDREIPGLTVNWCGSVLWDLPSEKLVAFVEEHKNWGYPVKLIRKAEIARLEPNLKELPEHAARVASEGTASCRRTDSLGCGEIWGRRDLPRQCAAPERRRRPHYWRDDGGRRAACG
jgi:glycine/D-amino acid oxidase-like deaminating enzyme